LTADNHQDSLYFRLYILWLDESGLSSHLTEVQIDELKRFTTTTVCNALELFKVRKRNEGFMLPEIVCRFPELDPVVGYAITTTSKAQEPAGPDASVDINTYYAHILSQPQPRIIVTQDLDARPVGALFGEVQASLHKALGCVGQVTNGGVRDLEECRRIGFQFFSSCVLVSHAYVHLEGFGKPVVVGGLTVGPGDLIHADRHGVCLIPPNVAPHLATACQEMEALERPLIELARSTEFTPARFVAARASMSKQFEEASNRLRALIGE
jgi:regulator of RNase E activity RraA